MDNTQVDAHMTAQTQLEQALRGVLLTRCTKVELFWGYQKPTVLYFGDLYSATLADQAWMRSANVLLVYCSWRIWGPTGLLASRAQENRREEDGTVQTQAKQIMLDKIARALTFDSVTCDLSIELDDGLRFEVFCNCADDPEADDYVYIHQDSRWIVDQAGISCLPL